MDYNKLITHGGVFHADDVLCAAIMQKINPDIEIERTFRVPENLPQDVIVADIGGGKYDHHQKDAKVREDGRKYAAIGLLLSDENIKSALIASQPNASVLLDENSDFMKEIRQIEDADNGVAMEQFHAISSLVHGFNPTWDEKSSMDEKFFEAVDFVKDHYVNPYMEHGHLPEQHKDLISDRIKKDLEVYEQSKERAASIVNAALDEMKNRIVVLPQYAPWDDVLIESDAEFVVYPSARGGYNLQCVPPEKDSFDKKVELPDWGEELPEGCTFEHPAKFLAAFETLETAVSAAEQIEMEAHQDKEFEELEDDEYGYDDDFGR